MKISIELTKEDAMMLCVIVGFATDVINHEEMSNDARLTIQFCQKIQNDVLAKLNEAEESRIRWFYWLRPSFWLSAIKKLFSGV